MLLGFNEPLNLDLRHKLDLGTEGKKYRPYCLGERKAREKIW